jgi:hypothetical protein
VTDRREQSEQLDLETAIEDAERGFADWDIFDNDEKQSDFLENAAPDPAQSGNSLPDRGKGVENEGRTCSKCGELRAIEDFAPDPSKASARKSHCKPCDAAKSRRYYEANRERVIARVSARNRRLSE